MWGPSLLAELTHSSLGELYGFRGESEVVFMGGYKATHDWGPWRYYLPSAPDFVFVTGYNVVTRYHFHRLHGFLFGSPAASGISNHPDIAMINSHLDTLW
jgi:hypothetical protein